jgi:O-antigen ligase
MLNLLPLVAAAVAILVLPGWSFSYDVIPKAVVALLGAAAALLRVGQAVPPALPLARIVYAEIATTILAALFSTHRQLSWVGGSWRREGAIAEASVLLLGLAFVAVPRERILRITVIGAPPIALYGILQYFGIDPLLNPAMYHVGEGAFQIVRPPSTLGHAAYFATYLLFAVFAGAALALEESSRVWKAVGLAVSGTATLALVLSGTRAALVGLIVGVAWVVLRDRKMNWRWVLAGAVLVAIVAVLFFSPGGEKLRARVHWSTEDRFGGGRPRLWRDSLAMSIERPLTGYGPETFALEFPRHESVELAAAFPDFYHESPHNIFLDALVSKGFLGLAPLVAVVLLGLRRARGALGGAFVAMLVSQQFTSFTIATELFFVISLAMLCGAGFSEGPANGQPAAGLPAGVRRVLAVVFVAFAFYLATGDALLAAARSAVDRHDFSAAGLLKNRAASWGAHADINFSRLMLAQSQTLPDIGDRLRGWLFAKQAATRATETAEDRHNALVNLAAFYAVENNAPMVERCLREAAQFAPNWFKSHWLLAQVLARDGRREEALREARLAVQLDGGKDPEVAQTLARLEPK